MALETNWLLQMQQLMRCCNNQGPIPNAGLQYAAIYLATKLEDITPDESTVDCPSPLAFAKAQSTCGFYLRDWDHFWEIMAQLAVFEKDNAPPVPAFYVFAAGVYEWTDTATTNSISVVGLLTTDVVTAYVTASDAGQVTESVVNDFANDQIDVTLDAAGSTSVEVTYQVLRPTP